MSAPTRATAAGRAYLDLQAEAIENTVDAVRRTVCEIAAITLDDGVVFEIADAIAEVIRDEETYTGVRVAMTAQLATARPCFRVDINVGDPVSPPPEIVRLPRLPGGEIPMRAYTLPTIYAEKIVTAIDRGFGTRFCDRPAGGGYNINQPQTNGAPGGSPPKRESLTWGIHLRG